MLGLSTTLVGYSFVLQVRLFSMPGTSELLLTNQRLITQSADSYWRRPICLEPSWIDARIWTTALFYVGISNTWRSIRWGRLLRTQAVALWGRLHYATNQIFGRVAVICSTSLAEHQFRLRLDLWTSNHVPDTLNSYCAVVSRRTLRDEHLLRNPQVLMWRFVRQRSQERLMTQGSIYIGVSLRASLTHTSILCLW